MPPCDSLKGTFARLKKPEFASGDVAIERSPIPPVLASGEILKKGTAVVTTFNLLDCANNVIERTKKNTIPKLSFRAVDLISKSFYWCANIAALKRFVLKYWTAAGSKE
jgi:hypothetical protein